MRKPTGNIVKINANALFSGRVKEHEIGCQCGQHLNVEGTRTGRISSTSSNTKSNTPKHGTPS